MPNSDRKQYASAGLIVAVLLLTAFCTQPNEPSAWEREGPSKEACAEKRYQVGNEPDAGFTVVVSRNDPACEHQSDSTTNAKNSGNRSPSVAEADLLAQERMAHWTAWIGVFTAVGLAVLYITFYVTRRTVEETVTIGEAQTRAYLAGLSARYVEKGFRAYAIELTIRNFGNSPAKIVRKLAEYQFDLLYRTPSNSAQVAILEQKGGVGDINTVSANAEAQIIIYAGITNNEMKDYPFRDEVVNLRVEVAFAYEDVFKKTSDITIEIAEDGEVQWGSPRARELKVTTREGRTLRSRLERIFEGKKKK